MFNSRGQGAIEYILIIGGALLVAVVIISILATTTNKAKDDVNSNQLIVDEVSEGGIDIINKNLESIGSSNRIESRRNTTGGTQDDDKSDNDNDSTQGSDSSFTPIKMFEQEIKNYYGSNDSIILSHRENLDYSGNALILNNKGSYFCSPFNLNYSFDIKFNYKGDLNFYYIYNDNEEKEFIYSDKNAITLNSTSIERFEDNITTYPIKPDESLDYLCFENIGSTYALIDNLSYGERLYDFEKSLDTSIILGNYSIKSVNEPNPNKLYKMCFDFGNNIGTQKEYEIDFSIIDGFGTVKLENLSFKSNSSVSSLDIHENLNNKKFRILQNSNTSNSKMCVYVRDASNEKSNFVVDALTIERVS